MGVGACEGARFLTARQRRPRRSAGRLRGCRAARGTTAAGASRSRGRRRLAVDRPEPRLRRSHALLADGHHRLPARYPRRGGNARRLLLRRQAVRDRRARRHPPRRPQSTSPTGGDDVAVRSRSTGSSCPGFVIDVSEASGRRSPTISLTAADMRGLGRTSMARCRQAIRRPDPYRLARTLARRARLSRRRHARSDAGNLHFPGIGEDGGAPAGRGTGHRGCSASTPPASTTASRPTSSSTRSAPQPACPTWRTSRICRGCRRPAFSSRRCR